MTLTYKLEYPDESRRISGSKIILFESDCLGTYTDRHTHTDSIALPGQLKQWVTNYKYTTRYSRTRQTSSPVPRLGELDKTYSSSLIMNHSLHYVKTWRHPQNEVITHCIAISERRSHSVVAMYRKFCEIWTCSFWDMRADRQTNTQTDIYRHDDRNTLHPYRERSN